MTRQFSFFNTSRTDPRNEVLPEGLSYQTELIDPLTEAALITRVSELPFKEFDFHGSKGKRRTVSFGWQYEFSGAGRLRKAEGIPEFLLPLRTRAAAFSAMEPESLQHVLVIEYGPGAGIGWHRDKPVFEKVIGVSLLAPCVLRFRRKIPGGVNSPGDGKRVSKATKQPKQSRAGWERASILAEPRSAYHLRGPARSEWEHSILRVDELRYSITFRSMQVE